jgi:gamma-glutamyltranspeptidase/glutathione hydrolase
MPESDSFTTRPVYMGRRGILVSGHYLAARAGQRMLDKGGNAIDAAVASGFALNLLMPHLNGLGGEVPILIYSASDNKVYSISGQGFSGKAATIDLFRKMEIKLIPGDGFLPATVPAAFGSWAFALMRFGTLTIKDVLEPSIELAREGFPIYAALRGSLTRLVKRFRAEWPTSTELYMPDGKVPAIGDLHKNSDWAAIVTRAVEAEIKARKHGRETAIQAAIDFWYKGEVAEKIVAYMTKTAISDASKKANKGILTKEDFAAWKPTIEPPVSVDYRGLTVYKCGPWTQGPVFLQQLRLLEGFDLAKLGHNSAGYIHTVIESAKLAFADRERFYGDPAHVKVPLEKLLSKEYADERRKLIDARKASMELRPGEGPKEPVDGLGELFDLDDGEIYDHDTIHTCAVDARGNLMAATCSGGWIPSSPVVPGLGFPMGTRGQMFDLDPHRPGALAPRKRPRTTLTPSLALKAGKPYLAFGTPGGDQQDQWTLQFFLNFVDHGMNLQQAIDAATFHSTHFPSSFYPRRATPGGVVVEGRIPTSIRKELIARGHKVTATRDWANGMVMAVHVGPRPGVLAGAVSPRGETGYVTGD